MSNTTNISLALSVRQPWAWLIIRPDITTDEQRAQARADGLFKDVENRTWPTKQRGPILIHAAKRFTWQEYHDCQNFLIESDLAIHLPEFESFQTGGIIGQVIMDDCRDDFTSPWFTGRYGFHFSSPEIIHFKPVSGRLGFFPV